MDVVAVLVDNSDDFGGPIFGYGNIWVENAVLIKFRVHSSVS